MGIPSFMDMLHMFWSILRILIILPVIGFGIGFVWAMIKALFCGFGPTPTNLNITPIIKDNPAPGRRRRLSSLASKVN